MRQEHDSVTVEPHYNVDLGNMKINLLYVTLHHKTTKKSPDMDF